MVSHETYWSTITDCNGAVEQELSYDAWGNLRDPNTWQRNWYNPALEEPMFDRGYTGHEHMTAFGLINMNGRCYDPVMSSFLSVDAYVQDPTNAQAFNRYAYCAYNPLRYTDPTGWVYGSGPGNGVNPNLNTGGHSMYHSDDPNDVLWGRSVHPGGNSSSGYINGVACTSTGYAEGNNGLQGSNATGGGSTPEAVGSPVYDEHGYFLGTDDGGLQGMVIIMKREDFVQGMNHDEALSLATNLDENDTDAEIRLYNHYKELSNRPDWDGFVTIEEGIAWAKSHMGALQNPTPNNMLYINTSLLDFGNLSIIDFKNGEGKISPINLFNTYNTFHSITNPILRSTVYALGRVNCYLDDATLGMFHIVNDYFQPYGRATDYDWNGGGGIIRSNAIRIETKRANIPNGAGFRVYFYGVGYLNR